MSSSSIDFIHGTLSTRRTGALSKRRCHFHTDSVGSLRGASHRFSAGELDDWLFRFDTIYPVHVINVHGISQKDAEAWWRDFVRQVTVAIAKKMSFGDALLLREAENYNAEAIVTWNTKDFLRRTRLAVHTPTGFLRQY